MFDKQTIKKYTQANAQLKSEILLNPLENVNQAILNVCAKYQVFPEKLKQAFKAQFGIDVNVYSRMIRKKSYENQQRKQLEYLPIETRDVVKEHIAKCVESLTKNPKKYYSAIQEGQQLWNNKFELFFEHHTGMTPKDFEKHFLNNLLLELDFKNLPPVATFLQHQKNEKARRSATNLLFQNWLEKFLKKPVDYKNVFTFLNYMNFDPNLIKMFMSKYKKDLDNQKYNVNNIKKLFADFYDMNLEYDLNKQAKSNRPTRTVKKDTSSLDKNELLQYIKSMGSDQRIDFLQNVLLPSLSDQEIGRFLGSIGGKKPK